MKFATESERRAIYKLAARMNATPAALLPRERVRLYPCPECGAVRDESCVGARGKQRVANHMARVFAAVASEYNLGAAQ